jgi:hypothetical protein
MTVTAAVHLRGGGERTFGGERQSAWRQGELTGVKPLVVGSNSDSTWRHNRVTLSLEGTWLSRFGSLESEVVKCGHESPGTRTQE